MNHTAIFALYPNVVTIDDTVGSKDVNGDTVVIDETLVNAWVDPNAYKYAREKAYPPSTDYLDGIVKSDQAQVDKYIADCLAVKAQYPKGDS